MTDPAVTYASYLKIDELLTLQQPRSQGPEHDELLFIVIHQVYELWFKELLHEFDRVRQLLDDEEPHRAQHTLKRILTILKVMVAQLDILETMTPLEFLSFRERLEAASGFQSDQFRQIEFLLGVKSQAALRRFPEGSRARAALERRYQEPTVWDAFLRYLSKEGYAVPPAHLERDVAAAIEPSAEVQRILVAVYRDDTKNAELCERLVDLDEGIQEWRYRHVKMVERTIGAKSGTGGSAGAAYLQANRRASAFSGSLADPVAVVAPHVDNVDNLAAHYSRFRVAERLLLTGHSHQAWPDVSFDAQQRAWLDAAELVDDKWERAAEQAARVQQGFRRLLNDPDGDIALGQNTHELVTRLLSALPLRARPKLVTTDGEFHTIRRQLDRLAEEGLAIVKVAARPAETLTERLARVVDDAASCVLVSSVLYDTAEIVPGIDLVARACDRHGATLLVDAYHHLNVVPFDIAALGLGGAFVTGGGYKYLPARRRQRLPSCAARVPASAGPDRLVQRVRRARAACVRRSRGVRRGRRAVQRCDL